MRKILFDGLATQSLEHTLFHGGGEYAKFVLREAISRNLKFDIVFSKMLITDPVIKDLLSKNTQYKVFEITDKFSLYQMINRNNYDIFYSALPYLYGDYNCNAILIGVIHGLRPIELPWDEFRYKYALKSRIRFVSYLINRLPALQHYLRYKHRRNFRKLLLCKNAKFITVSNHSKYALLNFYPFLNEQDIEVFYSPFLIEKIAPMDFNSRNYYLMISANRYEKNVYRAVLAFDKLFSDGRLIDKRVIVTGCGNQPFWKELRNKSRFTLLPYVSSSELEKLYGGAYCFVYPSLNEGFGYPPLKAMGYGVPVIASSATSIPEVCGDAACYFSPTSVDDLCNRILQIETNVSLRKILVEKGFTRVRQLLDMQQVSFSNMLNCIFSM